MNFSKEELEFIFDLLQDEEIKERLLLGYLCRNILSVRYEAFKKHYNLMMEKEHQMISELAESLSKEEIDSIKQLTSTFESILLKEEIKRKNRVKELLKTIKELSLSEGGDVE